MECLECENIKKEIKENIHINTMVCKSCRRLFKNE